MLIALSLTLLAFIAALGVMFWLGTDPRSPKVTVRLAIRLAVVFVPTAAACFAMFVVAAGILPSTSFFAPLGLAGALLASLGVTYYTCLRRSSFPPTDLFGALLLGAFVTGGLAFLFGVFGAMLLLPDSPYASVLGIFRTGPLGFVLGALGGAVLWFRHRRQSATRPTRGAG